MPCFCSFVKFPLRISPPSLYTIPPRLCISPPEIIRSNFPHYARCEGTLSMIAYNTYSNENKDVLNLIQPDWIQEPENSRPIMYLNLGVACASNPLILSILLR